MTTAVVPLKAPTAAKTRLATCLSGPARGALVAWMLARVLATCDAAPSVDEVVLLAGDAEAAALATGRGVRVLRQTAPGLRGALREADALLSARASTLVLMADLPWCSVADIEDIVAAAPAGPCVVLAPTPDGGTGALLRRPGRVIPPGFGPRSAAAHAEAARKAGVPLAICRRWGLSRDLDTPAQLRAACAALPELAALLGPLPSRQAS